jgi:uncharacterized alpha-E superfamily protein
LRDEIAILDPAVATDTFRLVLAGQDTGVPPGSTLEQQAALLRRVAADRTLPSSLASNLDYLGNLLDRIKVRMPPEAWQMLRQMRRRPAILDTAACVALQQQLTAFEGLTAEAMPRDTAWRFLDLGRRIERGGQLLSLLRGLLHPADGSAPTEFRLQTVLHLADCLSTYRSVFHGSLNTVAALDWLFHSPENPRGLHFQVDRINTHLALLPEELAPQAVAALRTLAFRILSDVRLAPLEALAADPAKANAAFQDVRQALASMSDQLTQIYFSHAVAG